MENNQTETAWPATATPLNQSIVTQNTQPNAAVNSGLTEEELEALTPPGFKNWAEYEAHFDKGKTANLGWIRLYLNETQPHWIEALEGALSRPCAVCGETLASEEYIWQNIETKAVNCRVCWEAAMWADGYEIDGWGYASCWNSKHSREQRIAERERNSVQKLERQRCRRLETPEGQAWLATVGGQAWQDEQGWDPCWSEANIERELRGRLAELDVTPDVIGTLDDWRKNLKTAATTVEGIQQLASVEMAPVVFIDKPLFQANAFHLLVGKKNAGKGTFLSSVAARFTHGQFGEARNVIWIAAGEDSLSLDVRPRIEAARGDPWRVYYPTLPPKLPEAVAQLRGWITGIGRVGLVVLDPISGMLRSGTNTNMDSDVRSTIAPLNQLADEARCLIIGVRHLRKDASQGALESVLGATDWVNVPRAVLAIVMDNEDENIRHVQVVAGNRIERGTASRSFRIVGANVVRGGEPIAKAVFIDGPGKDVDEVLQSEPNTSNSKTKLAKIAMLDKLEEAVSGSLESDTLTAETISELGIAKKTVQNAKTQLKEKGLIAFFPDKDEAGQIVQWNVKRTNAPRPPDLQAPAATPDVDSTSRGDAIVI